MEHRNTLSAMDTTYLPKSQRRWVWEMSRSTLLMWCIVIKCLVCLPCVLSSCHGVNISVALYPEGMINVRYGEPLEIFCIAENNFTANDLRFLIGGNEINSEIVNGTTRKLYIEHAEKQLAIYHCRNNVTNKHCMVRVLVDSPPSDNITDFDCISKNLIEFTCSWTPIQGLSKTDYTLSMILNPISTYKHSIPLAIQRDGEKWSMTLNTTSKPRYRSMEEQYIFLLKSCNVFGCHNQTFIINHFASVKPDPPVTLKVVNQEPHSVLLSWNIPNNIVDFLACPIVHRIEYQIAKIDSTDYFRSVDTSILKTRNNKKSYTFLLSNLPYAHMSYEVRIWIKPENATDKYWSDFAYISFTTTSERPQRPPDTMVGAFDQAIFNDKRIIKIYWKPLEKYEEVGSNFTYKVTVLQASENPRTIVADMIKSFVTINDVSFEAVDVSIWSINEAGSSVNNSHLYIPPKRVTDDLQVHSFSKVSYDNGTYKLSWMSVEDAESYTLFWCTYYSYDSTCSTALNFINLEPNRNTYISMLPEENKYQFAIAAKRGINTSGMTWAEWALPLYD